MTSEGTASVVVLTDGVVSPLLALATHSRSPHWIGGTRGATENSYLDAWTVARLAERPLLEDETMGALSLFPRALRHRFIRSRMGFAEKELAKFEVTVADGEADAFAAARTVHDSYVERGIIDPHPSGMRVTPHLVLPTTRVFVAKVEGRVVGTISLIRDTPLGLPMDDVYGDELAAMRAEGHRIAEVGALAIDREYRGVGLVFLLNRIMFECAARLGVERLVIAVHPEAEDIYAASMLFERFGEVRHYPGLNRSALAVALTLDLTTAEECLARAFGYLGPTTGNTHHMYFVRPCHEITLCGDAVSDETGNEKRAAIGEALVGARPDAFRGLSRAELAYLSWILPDARCSFLPRLEVQDSGAFATFTSSAVG